MSDGLDGAVARLHELVQVGPIDAVMLKFGDMPEIDNDLVARGRRWREGGRGEEVEAAAEVEEEATAHKDTILPLKMA